MAISSREYQDPLYGPVPLDAIAAALLGDPAVARLGGIFQSGILGLIGWVPDYTRRDHAAGVWALLRRIDAPVVEQWAGLLHDCAHTALSHVADFVFSDGSRSVHGDPGRWERAVGASTVPAICARAGIDWRTLNPDRPGFTLLDRPVPALCADRLDSALRSAWALGLIQPHEAQTWLASLHVCEHALVVDGVGPARWLAELYMDLGERLWLNPVAVGLYVLAADALRLALDRGVIGNTCWNEDDRTLWLRLRSSDDPEVRAAADCVHPDVHLVPLAEGRPIKASPPLRYLDPPVGHPARPLSSVDPSYRAVLECWLAAKRSLPPVAIARARTNG